MAYILAVEGKAERTIVLIASKRSDTLAVAQLRQQHRFAKAIAAQHAASIIGQSFFSTVYGGGGRGRPSRDFVGRAAQAVKLRAPRCVVVAGVFDSEHLAMLGG